MTVNQAAAVGTPRRRLAASGTSALLGMLAVAAVGPWWLVPLGGWTLGAVVFVTWMWCSIWPMDAGETARNARSEDPNRRLAEVILLSASLISLLALGLVLVRAGETAGLAKGLLVGSCVLSVVLAWAVVHTVYTLRYADLYYAEEAGGIDFGHEPPAYADFAYLAWTIGMTFQVSDTDVRSSAIRRTALRHALLSYMFGALIIATTINLIAGLGK